ncbi:cytochrome c3 family protein [Flagellimonas myxillae]|uniref:cytochrome c3 family protein n=1 Tax=Flagellimonas myxillae TaxID=2942214 RepID=UPI00201F0A0E|nr:cytochrome c3 family protein [Muricauda myxillae]MCL6267881.1 cytochrome c family protein [Muricauda myxillae]
MNKKRLLYSLMILLAVLCAAVVYHCKNPNMASDYQSPDAIATHLSGEQFAGSESCMECHSDIFTTHLETAHFQTSAIANAENIKGSFTEGSNVLDLKDVRFTMKIEQDSFFQHVNIKNRAVEFPPSKFDIVIGSGVRGQTYLTWDGDGLFQLQPSYHTASDGWINSPGYPTHNIKRPINDACLKCHLTVATNLNSSKRNTYNKEKMLYGVDCERCHRPSLKHVAYHRENPEVPEAKFMLNISELPKQQRLDICAQCHSGLREVTLRGSPFSFLAGENLDDYSQNMETQTSNSSLDVHGNQYGLLTSSKCFQEAGTIDCSTCHDPHKNQRGQTAFFNQKCMACHNTATVECKVESHKMESVANNCIACHMPSFPSKVMTAQVGKDSLETSFFIRTHLIAIYEEEQWDQSK